MVDNFDLTTAAGVTALTVLVIQLLKSTIITPNQPHTGLMINIATVVVAFGLSFSALLLTPPLAWTAALINGCISTATAISSYELGKNTIQATRGQ